MTTRTQLIPIGHPNRFHQWKLEALSGYVIHSTANLWSGAGDEWHANWFARPFDIGDYLEGAKVFDLVERVDEKIFTVKEIKTGKLLQATSTNAGITYQVNGATYANGIQIFHGPLEKGSIKNGYGQKFRISSTHAIADDDSVTEILPLDEFAAGAGDRPLPWTPELKGQHRLARDAFGNRQNYRTRQIEVTENKDSIWEMALCNACDWIIRDMRANNLTMSADLCKYPSTITAPPPKGQAYVVRHGDLTGKNCPSRLMADDDAWGEVVNYIAKGVKA